MKAKDRIKEIRIVKGRDLLPNIRNWRSHGEAQRGALRATIKRVGVADVLKAWEPEPGRVELLDGHMRAAEYPDHDWQVAILDVNEKEAAFILATMDPLAAMAETNADAIAELLEDIGTRDQFLSDMLDSLIPAGPIQIPQWGAEIPQGGPGHPGGYQDMGKGEIGPHRPAQPPEAAQDPCFHGAERKADRGGAPLDAPGAIPLTAGKAEGATGAGTPVRLLKWEGYELTMSDQTFHGLRNAIEKWGQTHGMYHGFLDALVRSFGHA